MLPQVLPAPRYCGCVNLAAWCLKHAAAGPPPCNPPHLQPSQAMMGGQPAALMASCAARLPGTSDCSTGERRSDSEQLGWRRPALHGRQRAAAQHPKPSPALARWARHGASPKPARHPQPGTLPGTHLLQHEGRLRVARLPAPGAKHAGRRLQRARQRRHDDGIRAEGAAQDPDVPPQRQCLTGQEETSAWQEEDGHRCRHACRHPPCTQLWLGCCRPLPTCRHPKSVRCASSNSKLLREREK